MNLRKWSRLHTYGLLLGISTTLVIVPILSLLFDAFDNPLYWFLHEAKGKLISLASIANLAWFHWFIKTKKTVIKTIKKTKTTKIEIVTGD